MNVIPVDFGGFCTSVVFTLYFLSGFRLILSEEINNELECGRHTKHKLEKMIIFVYITHTNISLSI